jgi:hypothetical protein
MNVSTHGERITALEQAVFLPQYHNIHEKCPTYRKRLFRREKQICPEFPFEACVATSKEVVATASFKTRREARNWIKACYPNSIQHYHPGMIFYDSTVDME